MCFRCYENDPPPSPFMRSIFAFVDASLPAEATGAEIVDATSRAFREAGPPPGAQISGDLASVAVRDLIRAAKRSGVGINSPNTSAAKARPVLRAVAAGLLRVAEAA